MSSDGETGIETNAVAGGTEGGVDEQEEVDEVTDLSNR